MLGGTQWLITPDAKKDQVIKLGDGLEPILAEIRDKRDGETRTQADERYEAYQYYLYHKHNVDRMSLEKKSLEKNRSDVQRYAELSKQQKDLTKKIKANKAKLEEIKGKYTKEAKAERARIKQENAAYSFSYGSSLIFVSLCFLFYKIFFPFF